MDALNAPEDPYEVQHACLMLTAGAMTSIGFWFGDGADDYLPNHSIPGSSRARSRHFTQSKLDAYSVASQKPPSCGSVT